MMLKLHSRGGGQQLAEERRTLAERYTIDAEEAHRRKELAAAQAEREISVVEPEPEPAPQPVPQSAPQPVLDLVPDRPEPALPPAAVETTEEESTASSDLPIYRWFDGR
jgi:hypothetical protein